jgi:DNA-binding transcriptional LysR family regulator
VSKLPDLEGLAIFAKVVQTRSFVGAAHELRLSKATVSKAVSRIEKKFGTRLFNRSARRLAVTEAGRQLYDRAAHILAEGEAAEDEVVAQSAVPEVACALLRQYPLVCSILRQSCRSFSRNIRT